MLIEKSMKKIINFFTTKKSVGKTSAKNKTQQIVRFS